MRKLNTQDFRVATRTTSREINKHIALNLIREQPISRVALAARMGVQRSVVSLLINELIAEKLVYEGGNERTLGRGPKPTLLFVKTQNRLAIAIDVRFTKSYLMLSDFSGRQIALETFDTIFSPSELIKELASRVRKLLQAHKNAGTCEGIGLAAPGIVEHRTGRILHAPMMGWRNVDLLDDLAAQTGLPVAIESAPKACAMAQIWLSGNNATADALNFAYVMISDGVGVGAVTNGELLRGHDNAAGEFGHTPLNIDGPRCLCGLSGCWEAYTSNLATLSRYLGRTLSRTCLKNSSETAEQMLTIAEVINRARAGDPRAVMAIQTTARYIGLGLGTIVAAINPARIYIGGEITAAWDFIEVTVRTALVERTLTEAAAQTPIEITDVEYPRLRGAVALVAAPTYALPRVA